MNVNEQLQSYLAKSASSKGMQKSASTSSFFGLLSQSKSDFSSSNASIPSDTSTQDDGRWYSSLSIPGLMTRQPAENVPQSRCQKFLALFPTLVKFQTVLMIIIMTKDFF